MNKKKAIILGGSRGIGLGISQKLEHICDVKKYSKSDLDTSNIDQVKNFYNTESDTDILVLNTGGPPPIKFDDITEALWDKYYNQLFKSFALILQNLKINNGGFIFAITSFNIKEPDPKLVLSNAYRIAFVSLLKSISKTLSERNISVVNIAPGPILTDRLEELCDDIPKLEKTLPLGRVGNTDEIGNFVYSIVNHNIKYLNGVTINFDGGISNYVL
ncbi:MAG: short-chain dehydrogenase [Verrucomicrobiales bacterium]|nr:short-chain dehydrogenase [Verrucomicrobiales bacterium]